MRSLSSALLLAFILLLDVSIHTCKESKHTKTTTNKNNKNRQSNKNKKRWMNFGQNFMNNEPEQFAQQYPPDNAFTPVRLSTAQVDNVQIGSYGFGSASLSSPGNTFQGMEELKIPKQSYSPAEDAQAYAQDIASYLKPGIGDYPSDMPGGMKTFEVTSGIGNGIGMPISSKPKGTRLTPVAALVQTAIEDSALNPQSVHKQQQQTSFDSASILADAINNDEVSPAKVTLGVTSKTDSSTVVHLDKDPSKIDDDKEVVKIVKQGSKEKGENGKALKEEQKETKGDKEKEVSKTAKEKTNSDDDKTNEEEEQIKEITEAFNEKNKENLKDDSKEKESKDDLTEKESEKTNNTKIKDKTKKLKGGKANKFVEKEQNEEKIKSEDKEKEEQIKSVEENKKEGKEEVQYKSSKHKTETGERRQSYESFVDTGNNRIEAVGLPTLTAPNEFSDSEEKDVSITLKEDGNSDGDDELDKTPNKVKAKLVSSLRNALLQNVKELMDESAVNDLEVSSTKMSVSEENKDHDKEERKHKEEKDSVKEEASVDVFQPDLLEENLMKIDKKKLVHLLATMMRRNREKQRSDDDDEREREDNSKEINKTKTKEKSQQLSSEDHGEHFVHVSTKPSSTESTKQRQGGVSHQPKLSTFGLDMDPYAEIGLVDPTNDDASYDYTGRHSVHSSHGKKENTSSDVSAENNKENETEATKNSAKENEREAEKEEKERKEEKVVKQKQKERVKQAKKEREEEKVEEINKESAEEKAEEINKESAEEKAEEINKERAEEKAEEIEKGKAKAEENAEKVDESKLISSEERQKEKEKQNAKENEKLSAKEEAKKVEEQVEKERQELKKLKEEEQKEKQEKLKTSNEQEDKHKISDDIKSDEEQKPIRIEHGNFVHLISPDLMNAIAEDLKTGKGLSLSDETKDENTSEEKQEPKDEDKHEQKEENIKGDDSKGDESKSEYGPNIQKLIENLKEKLLGGKQQKQSKTKNSRRHHSQLYDAYAQIGSTDQNVKRRGREKKQHVHRPHKH